VGDRAVFILRRIGIAIPLIWLIATVAFIIVLAAPGDPITVVITAEMTEDQVAQLMRQAEKYSDPWALYKEWMGGLLRGSWGVSFMTKRPVIQEFMQRWPASMELALASFFFTLVVSIPMGIIGASKQYTPTDTGITFLAFFGVSMPNFWLALLLIILFAFQLPALLHFVFDQSLGWITIPSTFTVLPISGRIGLEYSVVRRTGFYLIDTLLMKDFRAFLSALSHLILPVFVSGTAGMAGLTRYVRSGMLENMKSGFVRTARASGIPEKSILYRYVFRNGLIPLVTILGPSITILISGSVVIETIFGWPGLGRFFTEATFNRDYPVIMMSLVAGTTLSILGNLIADLLYGIVDPRISVSKGYGGRK
jgi:ABC-type dipeptide/oligopeptide/nickel transport system permease component